MRWQKMGVTNVVGERSVMFKLEGSDFRIVASPEGVRFEGSSLYLTEHKDMEEFAKTVAEAFQSYQFYLRAKIGGLKNAVQIGRTKKEVSPIVEGRKDLPENS